MKETIQRADTKNWKGMHMGVKKGKGFPSVDGKKSYAEKEASDKKEAK